MATSIPLLVPRSKSERAWETTTRATVRGAGLLVAAALAGVAIFLSWQGWPGLTAGSADLPAGASSFWALAGPLAFGSIWSALLALLLAIPVAIAVAAFVTWDVRPQVGRFLGAVIDLLAAVPSVVYGLWGLMVIAPLLAQGYNWLHGWLGWIPLFAGQPSATGRTILTAAVILALMIMPIIAAISREVFAQTPVPLLEGALALGATRWETMKLAVLPHARSGIISGAMLGLGRALGETMVTAMVISPVPFLVSFQLLTSSNPNTVAAFIAQNFPEAHGLETNALIALGLVLFALTFVVNAIARRIARPKATS